MKKYVLGLLSILMCFTLVACSNKTTDGETVNDNSNVSETELNDYNEDYDESDEVLDLEDEYYGDDFEDDYIEEDVD